MGVLLNAVFLSSSFFFFLFVAREEISDSANWGREQSVIDLLRGTDGHLYKGRFRQVRPLAVSRENSMINLFFFIRFKEITEKKKRYFSNSYTIEPACVHATPVDFTDVNMHNTRSRSLTACVCFICQTIPPIPKSSQSPTQEYESSLSKEESLGTSTRSTSGPSSPRNPAVGEVK